jgi:hypothetical protein
MCILFALVPEACVCVQCDIYLSILDSLSIYLSMYLVCIYLHVPGPCGARGACAGVWHVCVCVCVCVCVSLNYFALVLSLCYSTGVRVRA